MNFKDISIESTRKDLTALSGLIFFKQLIARLNLENRLAAVLPRKSRGRGKSPKSYFTTGMLGMIAGAECVDDHLDLREESFFCELTDGGAAPATLRRFMGTLKLKYFEKLQDLLPTIAWELRSLYQKRDSITISMDATIHQQHGQKMEGVDWCYNKSWGYTSQNAFDEYGFCYGWNLMTGNSHSNTGAVEMIERIFTKIPTDQKRYFRADSAYGSHKIYNALIGHNVGFAICQIAIVWEKLINEYGHRITWLKTRMRFFDSPHCQIGSLPYKPKNLKGSSVLRVVFIRAKKKIVKSEDKYSFDYYAIGTNMRVDEMSDEQVVQFYRGRANAENFIKDLKYGLDFKHFPCQAMNKNKTWGFMGVFAYNLMRFSSFIIDKRGCYLKRVRNKMVFLAAELKRGQRKIKLRMTKTIYQEVKRLTEMIELKFCSPGRYRSVGPPQAPPSDFAL